VIRGGESGDGFPEGQFMRSAQRFEGEHNAVWRGMGFLVAEAEELPLMDPDTALVAQEQLRKLARRNRKGTREEAVRKNVKHVDRAKKAARSLPAVDAFDKVKIQAVGRGSLEVRKAVEKGALPPEPFATHGAKGWTGGDNPSWWREWCRAGHRQRDACGRGTDGDCGAVSTMVADGGSALSDEAARAVRATRSGLKPSHVALPTEWKADGTACEEPRREIVPEEYVESLRPKSQAGQSVPRWLQELGGTVQHGVEFWEKLAERQMEPLSRVDQATMELEREARRQHRFEDWDRTKGTAVWLLELAASRAWRQEALDALKRLPNPRAAVPLGQAVRALIQSDGPVILQGRGANGESVAPSGSEEREWLERLNRAQANVPYAYEPVETERGRPMRAPYEGSPSRLTVGEFAVGVGCFLACARAAGMQPMWMADSDREALRLAGQNCPEVPMVFGDLSEVDPTQLPWCHVLVGGACCQPFSKAGKQLGFEDDRAYSTIRMLHNVAAVRPWFAVSENVENLLHIHGGKDWDLVAHIFGLLGYGVQAVLVCPSR
jgi:hypothetical protein